MNVQPDETQPLDTRVTQLERRVDDLEHARDEVHRLIGIATRPPTPANTMSVTEAATYTGWSERQLYRLGIVTRGRVLNTAAEQHRRHNPPPTPILTNQADT